MTTFYDEIEIEDFVFDPILKTYFYPCPCGDKFQILLEELYDGEEIATCPSCSLMIRVIYERDLFLRNDEDEVLNMNEISVR